MQAFNPPRQFRLTWKDGRVTHYHGELISQLLFKLHAVGMLGELESYEEVKSDG